ncbi:MAG: MFS transporter, partial [Sphingomonas sp.]|uniref:MFS transporter n=1 Tax=Sphingomonas sp. TaxID=28214 RepID=UPI00178F3A10
MPQPAKTWSMARVITASSAGTAFEWYDFFIFGSLASVISKVFFAGLEPTSAMIAALGLFAAGFAFRPLGAIIFGAMGDRIGRKATFLTTVSLMGGATFAIGLLPTYGQAGTLAPILLIFLRICQGTALGGEYGGAATYVAEHAEDHRRGWATGWIQSSAAVGLIGALGVILVTRTIVGEEAFAVWGWRVPFLASILLLAISVWMRFKLDESPAFAKIKAEGTVTKAPLREAFADRANLKIVAIAFFAFMAGQGAVWYSTFFYIQVFLEKTLGMAGATVNLVIMAMTIVSAPLYVFFGALSDRVGRKKVMVGGMALALVAYIPGYHAIADAVNPALVAAQSRTPVVIETDPATCSVQFDPVGTAKFSSPCDIAKSLLASTGIGYSQRPSLDGATRIRIGQAALAMPDGSGLDGPGLKALKSSTGADLKSALAAAGYPAGAAPEAIDWVKLFGWLLVFVIGACALYGPQAAA